MLPTDFSTRGNSHSMLCSAVGFGPFGKTPLPSTQALFEAVDSSSRNISLIPSTTRAQFRQTSAIPGFNQLTHARSEMTQHGGVRVDGGRFVESLNFESSPTDDAVFGSDLNQYQHNECSRTSFENALTVYEGAGTGSVPGFERETISVVQMASCDYAPLSHEAYVGPSYLVHTSSSTTRMPVDIPRYCPSAEPHSPLSMDEPVTPKPHSNLPAVTRPRKRRREVPEKKGPWTDSEDQLLRELVARFGPRKWREVAHPINGRTGKQARERWMNQLAPQLKKDVKWSEVEDRVVVLHQAELGNKWSKIASYLSGRTDNHIKNRFNSTLKRKRDEGFYDNWLHMHGWARRELYYPYTSTVPIPTPHCYQGDMVRIPAFRPSGKPQVKSDSPYHTLGSFRSKVTSGGSSPSANYASSSSSAESSLLASPLHCTVSGGSVIESKIVYNPSRSKRISVVSLCNG